MLSLRVVNFGERSISVELSGPGFSVCVNPFCTSTLPPSVKAAATSMNVAEPMSRFESLAAAAVNARPRETARSASRKMSCIV